MIIFQYLSKIIGFDLFFLLLTVFYSILIFEVVRLASLFMGGKFCFPAGGLVLVPRSPREDG
jgi:hypothetical protein